MLKNPQHLPQDLLAQVEQSKVAIAPKSQNPLVVASEWITKAKSYQKNQNRANWRPRRLMSSPRGTTVIGNRKWMVCLIPSIPLGRC